MAAGIAAACVVAACSSGGEVADDAPASTIADIETASTAVGGEAPSSNADADPDRDEPTGRADESPLGDPPGRITICHRTNGSNEYVEITISESAVDAHRNHPWGDDIIPAPPEGCPDSVDPTTTVSPSTTDSSTTTTDPSPTTTDPSTSTTTSTAPTTPSTTSTSTSTSTSTTTTEPKPTTTLPGTTTTDPSGVLPTVSFPTTTLAPPASTSPPLESTTTPPSGSSTLPQETTTTETGAVIPAGPDELPGTGGDGWLALAAALALGAGAGLIWLARRPRLDEG